MLRGQNIVVLKGLLGWAAYMFYQHFAKQQITPVQHACHSREIRKSSEAKNNNLFIIEKNETDFGAMEKTEIDCKGLFCFRVMLHTQYMWPFKKKLKFIQLDRISPVIYLSMAMLYFIEFCFQFGLQTQ